MSSKINRVRAREILDSRGNPTVEARIELKNGVAARASVPSGASTGAHEAWELRDKNAKRYGGKGVLKACRNINKIIAPRIMDLDITKHKKIDQLMIELDGTQNKKKLGANAILGVSMACARAAAVYKRMELYEYLRQSFSLKYSNFRLPVPLINIFNGGAHADNDLSIQELIIIPMKPRSFKGKTRVGSEIFHVLGKVLKSKKMNTAVGNEGGYAPNVGKTEKAIQMILTAIKKAGYTPGKEVALGLDVAASEFFDAKKSIYEIKTDGYRYNSRQMIELYQKWTRKYPLISIEDGLDEDDWEGWKEMTQKLKKIMIIGDDLFVTNKERLKQGIEAKVANAILIKMNQIGTISETIETIKLAQKNKYKIAVSHRSGETCDNTIADLSVAVNAEYIKIGSLSRSERVSKYNRLMEIEDLLKGSSRKTLKKISCC